MKTEIEIPTVPNFLFVEVAGEKVKVAVSKIPVDELEEVGRRWTQKLIQNHNRPPISEPRSPFTG